jgi:hypothetical protein
MQRDTADENDGSASQAGREGTGAKDDSKGRSTAGRLIFIRSPQMPPRMRTGPDRSLNGGRALGKDACARYCRFGGSRRSPSTMSRMAVSSSERVAGHTLGRHPGPWYTVLPLHQKLVRVRTCPCPHRADSPNRWGCFLMATGPEEHSMTSRVNTKNAQRRSRHSRFGLGSSRVSSGTDGWCR